MRLSASRTFTRSASKITIGYMRSGARDCHSGTTSGTASVTRLIRCPAGYCAVMPERKAGPDLQPMDILKRGADITDRETGSVKTDDLVIHAVDPGLALLDQFRLETAVPVAGHQNRHFAVVALQPLVGRAIAPVGLARGRILAVLIARMCGQLSPGHPLHQPDLELFHQPSIARQIAAPQQFVR